jgi:hypothetical protein
MKLLRVAAAISTVFVTLAVAGCAGRTAGPSPSPSLSTPPVIYNINSGGMGDELWIITALDGASQTVSQRNTNPVTLAGPGGSVTLAWASPGLWSFVFAKDVSSCTAAVTARPSTGTGSGKAAIEGLKVTVQTSVDGKIADAPFTFTLTC